MGSYISRTIRANGIRIHYYRSALASGKIPILLLHGVTDDGMCWKLVTDALGDDYDLIMPDARGHGRSDKPASGYTFEDFAADAAALIGALGLDRPVVIGASMGGIHATVLAGLYPHLLRGIILEEPAWFDQQPGIEERTAMVNGSVETLIREQHMTREAIMASWSQEEPGWSAEELGLVADAHYLVSPDSLRQLLFAYQGTAWRDYMPKIECPVLLITCEKDGEHGMVKPSMVQEACALSKHVVEVHITDSRHCIHRDQYEVCLRAMKEFLKQTNDSSTHEPRLIGT